VIRLATRGSRLALIQAGLVRRALLAAFPDEEVAIAALTTRGDADRTRGIPELGVVNAFTAEIDLAVAEGRADAGVHSMKDLATRLADGLVLAATLERAPVEDVLVAPRHGGLKALPPAAAVGTGSPRRRAMVLRVRPDLRCVGIRGNVETRIGKVRAGEVDAAVLARAGVARLGIADEVVTEVLPLDAFLPAAGQGLLGITCRARDARILEALRSVRHEPSFAAGLAERSLMAALRAGCHAPVGALAACDGGRLVLRAEVLARDGASAVSGSVEGPAGDAEALGAALASDLVARGARRWLT
jgi:hydroxymethylbilane synthase